MKEASTSDTPILLDMPEGPDFSIIIDEMNVWERLVRLFYSLFRKDQLLEFYTHCGLKHIENKFIRNSSSWYNQEHKALDVAFADTLFHLVRSLDVLAPILKPMILSNNSNSAHAATTKETPEMIEVVFHSIHTGQSIQSYPFSAMKMQTLFEGVPTSQILKKKDHFVQEYIDTISQNEWIRMDIKYSNLMGVVRLMELPLLDFLRRFAFDVEIHSKEKMYWDLVTISAVDFYLETLFNVVDSFDLSRNDTEVILSLQESQKFLFELQNPATPLTNEEILIAWNELIDSLDKLKEEDTLYSLLCLAKKQPLLPREENSGVFSIKDRFCTVLRKRVSSTSNTVIKNILSKKIDSLLGTIILQKHHIAVPWGVYNIDNHKKIQRISNERLTHVFGLSAIYVFYFDSAQSWLKSFLGFLMVNAEFADPKQIDKLEQLYKKLNKFMVKFHSFTQEFAPKSPVSKRMQAFLDGTNTQLTDEQVRILKMFIDSKNSQSGVMISQFNELLTALIPFMVSVTEEIQHESQKFIPNILAVKKMFNKGEADRIIDFTGFCQNTERLIELEYQLNTLKNLKED
ncbi:MAG: hypothetical protein ACRCS8_03900 [Brevinema sp.]